MRIIISPAKKMKRDTDSLDYRGIPQFLEDARTLAAYFRGLCYEDAKAIWNCNEKIARLNYERFQTMTIDGDLSPAILTYDGIQYLYMSPAVLETEALAYLESHLRIVSGFYGLLRPFDGIVPYRLEMQARLGGKTLHSLYAFWNHRLADQLFSESDCIINLASKEYSRCFSDFLDEKIRFVTCVFGEVVDGKVVEKGSYLKMARGAMVRYLAENQIANPEEMKGFNRLKYAYSDKLSDENTYVFLKDTSNQQ